MENDGCGVKEVWQLYSLSLANGADAVASLEVGEDGSGLIDGNGEFKKLIKFKMLTYVGIKPTQSGQVAVNLSKWPLSDGRDLVGFMPSRMIHFINKPSPELAKAVNGLWGLQELITQATEADASRVAKKLQLLKGGV
jgi:hypothetical protein